MSLEFTYDTDNNFELEKLPQVHPKQSSLFLGKLGWNSEYIEISLDTLEREIYDYAGEESSGQMKLPIRKF